jgi:hypothetical protein
LPSPNYFDFQMSPTFSTSIFQLIGAIADKAKYSALVGLRHDWDGF